MPSTVQSTVVDELFAAKKADIKRRIETFVDVLVDELKSEVVQLLAKEDKMGSKTSVPEVSSSSASSIQRGPPSSPQPGDSSSLDHFDTADADALDKSPTPVLTKPPVGQSANTAVSSKVSLPAKENISDASSGSSKKESNFWKETQSMVLSGWNTTKKVGKKVVKAFKESFAAD